MNNENTAKKRGWIKNVAIIFLLILLLLTFFSNTIMTYSLPEVSAQYGQYSSLSTSVSLTGNVKANESYKVIYEPKTDDGMIQTRKVRSVYVREGDYVEKDQVIIALEGGQSTELSSLEEQYNSLKRQYALDLADDNVTYLRNSQTLEAAQTRYDDAKTSYDKLKAQYDKLMKDSPDTAEKADEIAAKRKELSAKVTALEEQISKLNMKIENAKAGAEGAEGSLAEMEMKFAELESDYKDAKEYEKRIGEQVSALSAKVKKMREAKGLTDTIQSLEEANASLYASFETNIAEIMKNNEQIAECEKKLSIIGSDKVTEIEMFQAEHDLEELNDEYADATTELGEITPIYESAKANIEAARKAFESAGELEILKAQLDGAEKELEAAKKELEENADLETLKAELKSAENEMKDAKTDLDITKNEQYKSNLSSSNNRADQKKQLDELEAKIKSYGEAPETLSVTAPIAGRIVSLYVVPGESVSSGLTVADLEIADKGYSCEVTVSTEEARKIQVGSPVTVSNSWWYSNIEASITQIRSDPQSQGKNKIVIFEIKGDVYEGQQLTLSVGDRSSSYDNVFPNSAIRQDSEGSYVLTVESKKTPLGIRYKAHRVNIEVVASDSTKTSVSGLLGGEFVITNSEKPISDGQMIRLADE